MMRTLQRAGQALIVPLAVLPIAGLLLGLGTAMQASLLPYLPFLEDESWRMVAEVMTQSGDILFTNLALLFAIGIATGLTKDKGITGFSAVIGFLVMNVVIGIFMPESLPEQLYDNVLGIETLQTSIFGGIIIGLVTVGLYERLSQVKLSDSFSFFSNSRFVPIATSFVAIIVGVMIAYIWPPIGNLVADFSESISANGTNPLFLWAGGALEQLLVPFGLDQMLYEPLWLSEAGGAYTSIDGTLFAGDQQNWQAQFADYTTYGYQALVDHIQAQGSMLAGRFMQGEYIFVLFGLPAAMLAIYHESAKKNRNVISGLLLVATITTIVTGISEPVEFLFLFMAPLLYIVHSLLAGLGFMLMYIGDIHIGVDFAGGLIEFIVNGVMPGSELTNYVRAIILGLAYVPLYYMAFRFTIRRFNLKTIGRDILEVQTTKSVAVANEQLTKTTQALIEALGGKANILVVESCLSRLRISVEDADEIDLETIKELGATGLFVSGQTIQAIFKEQAEVLDNSLHEMLELEEK